MNAVKIVTLGNIQTSKFNPRRSYDEVKMQELSNSIKEKGVINPILVRPVDGKFEVICGERRVRASRLASLKDIPAIIRDLTDEEALELQVIENLQRDDLNSIEEAQGFKALLEKCRYTQEKLAGKIGKSQGYIASRLALLNLTEDFQKDIISGRLLPGHVKYIMIVSDRPKILKAIRKEMGNHKEQLTVRAFESIVHTVLNRRTKILTKRSTWSDGPEFNTKECKECQFNRKINTYYGSPENRCVNSDCYNKKQRLARKAKAERIKKKMEKGGVVDNNQLKDVERFDGYKCKFDIKTCKRCDKKKVAKVRDYNGKVKTEEVCTDKECFNRKNKEAIEAQEKQREIEEQKRIEKIKAKAARTKMDRNFWGNLLGEKISGYFYGEEEATIKAYGLDVAQLKTKKAAVNYFTGNKELDLEEIFRFITYWND